MLQDGSIGAVVPSVVKRAVCGEASLLRPELVISDSLGPESVLRAFLTTDFRAGTRGTWASLPSGPTVARNLGRLLSKRDRSPFAGSRAFSFPARKRRWSARAQKVHLDAAGPWKGDERPG